MLRIDSGHAGSRYCDGVSRRSFVQLGVAGMASVGLADVMRAKAFSSDSPGGNAGKDERAVILLWLDGGPGHMDLYDMKPNAPVEYRGIWNPIKTNVPGSEITELFPRQAKVADKFAILRSLYHNTGDHFGGSHRMLTTKGGVNGSNRAAKFPSLGSVVTRQAGPRTPDMPPYISVPYASSVGLRPGHFGGHFLGPAFDPFMTDGNPNAANFQVRNVGLSDSLNMERLDDRVSLGKKLDRIQRQIERGKKFDSLDKFEQHALQLVTGPKGREAFDIGSEDDKLRDEYGRNTFGQSALLARRLVEYGARFVTVHSGGWDHHWNLQEGMERLLPQVDAAVASLLSDLDDRGMLQNTLVMLCGEFSRTPRMNDGSGNGTPGRDHWGNSMFTLLAGGGIRGGQVYGSTDSKGERPLENPVTVDNLHATVYKSLGVDPHIHLLNHQGRPTPVLEDPESIEGMFG